MIIFVYSLGMLVLIVDLIVTTLHTHLSWDKFGTFWEPKNIPEWKETILEQGDFTLYTHWRYVIHSTESTKYTNQFRL